MSFICMTRLVPMQTRHFFITLMANKNVFCLRKEQSLSTYARTYQNHVVIRAETRQPEHYQFIQHIHSCTTLHGLNSLCKAWLKYTIHLSFHVIVSLSYACNAKITGAVSHNMLMGKKCKYICHVCNDALQITDLQERNKTCPADDLSTYELHNFFSEQK